MRTQLMVAALAITLAACSPPQDQTAATPDNAPSQAAAGDSGEHVITDPSVVVRTLYDPYLVPNGTTPTLLEAAPWSDQMRADLAAMMQRAQTRGEPILDFDPIVNAQDYQLSDVTAGAEAISETSHAVVRASFSNNGQRQEVVYDLVWQGGGWKVDNIRAGDWDLRQIATAG